MQVEVEAFFFLNADLTVIRPNMIHRLSLTASSTDQHKTNPQRVTFKPTAQMTRLIFP